MQAEAEKPEQSRQKKNCLAMKTLNLEQMEGVKAGSLKSALSCVSQVTGGMGTLGGVAAILTFGTNPIGWGIFALGAISLIAGVASDPTACDS
jgi:hypothetical protein